MKTGNVILLSVSGIAILGLLYYLTKCPEPSKKAKLARFLRGLNGRRSDRYESSPGNNLGWFVADSYNRTCRPQMNPYNDHETFATREECEGSGSANFSTVARPAARRGWICANREIGQCIPQTIEPGMSSKDFSYHIFPTYQECVNSCSSSNSALNSIPYWGKAQAAPFLSGQGYSILRN